MIKVNENQPRRPTRSVVVSPNLCPKVRLSLLTIYVAYDCAGVRNDGAHDCFIYGSFYGRRDS
jgi:hypothetical protein